MTARVSDLPPLLPQRTSMHDEQPFLDDLHASQWHAISTPPGSSPHQG